MPVSTPITIDLIDSKGIIREVDVSRHLMAVLTEAMEKQTFSEDVKAYLAGIYQQTSVEGKKNKALIDFMNPSTVLMNRIFKTEEKIFTEKTIKLLEEYGRQFYNEGVLVKAEKAAAEKVTVDRQKTQSEISKGAPVPLENQEGKPPIATAYNLSSGEKLTYSVSGAGDPEAFSIDPVTGQVTSTPSKGSKKLK